MSFGNLARRVRDTDLPFRWRVSALRSCVQLHRPLGFQATLSYLESRAGRFQRDEAALLRALDLLESNRAAFRAELRAYAAVRRAAKGQGRRAPRAGDANPNTQVHWYWYEAPREAALHALWFWRRRRSRHAPSPDEALPELDAWVSDFLDSDGVLSPPRRELLAARLAGLEPRLRSPDLLRVVRHVQVASGLVQVFGGDGSVALRSH
ncbi:hypothetical protein AB0L05_24755 [Nonomuraea pusilla]|uniref:hypothetical protein n=1 Tax=Nonomuraea pusilla TaxID=46177 RepID=UPI00332C5C9E